MQYSKTIVQTVQKSRNINKAKEVSNFLICGTNNIVEHYGKIINILHGVILRADLTGYSQFSQSADFCQKGQRVGWPCPVRSALKRTSVQDFNSFSIIFYYIFSTSYQKIEDLFCPVIFLDFRTVSVLQLHLYKYLI
jgi:hypothetical protein